jgi:hypothetical protein
MLLTILKQLIIELIEVATRVVGSAKEKFIASSDSIKHVRLSI